VVVVEHDREAMEESDWLVDFGPGAGRHGGEIVAEGTPKMVKANPKSVTGQYLKGTLSIETPEGASARQRQEHPDDRRPREQPQERQCDVPARQAHLRDRRLRRGQEHAGEPDPLPGGRPRAPRERSDGGRPRQDHRLEHIDKVIDIDQTPIGRTPRSNPATYTKVFDLVREFFAELPQAKQNGYTPGRFSFNVKGGRCEACEGDGVKCVEMHFLPDVYVPCEVCQGKRFNDATLTVTYNGLSIADVLAITVDESRELFKHHPQIKKALDTLADVGLGYIALGQSSPTLSGGEAQRVKLSRELSKRSTGRTLYVLDEPTTGLHFDDIRKLLRVVNRLVDAGNTMVVIEHNLDVIKTADWIIEVGPEGGHAGGRILATGTPEQIAAAKTTATGAFLAEML
jgi:excinuclease ABC subunit A